MKCKKPFVKNGQAYGCGQCLPCRISRRRLWTHRLLLESRQHSEKTFATLTYSEEHLPMMTGDGCSVALPTLIPKHLSYFVRLLRREIEPFKLRFYGVGEYGDASGRPHYHIILWGVPNCVYGRTGGLDPLTRWDNCCVNCRRVGNVWRKGNIFLGDVGPDSCQYVAQYTTKKMTGRSDDRLKAPAPCRGVQYPEFAAMSRQPGIGADATEFIADVFKELGIQIGPQGDVPAALRTSGRLMPLGRYLRRRLRKLMSISEDGAPTEAAKYALWEETMRPLQEGAVAAGKSLKEYVAMVNESSSASIEERQKIMQQRKRRHI